MSVVTDTVFIIDDDASVRTSLSRLLRSEGIGNECFDSASAYLERDVHDGVGAILLDINMPGMSGVELQAKLVERGHDLPVVFLTGHGDVSNSVAAMKRGALEFLTKPVDEVDLLDAVRKALDHHRRSLGKTRARDKIRERIASLTPREHEVMLLLITGAPNKIIADALDIAVKTVKVHRAHVMEKMSVRSAAELLHLCHLAGVEPDARRFSR
jgi:FixJ family two-component response regulator